jgi:hypothetical protein
VIKVRVYYSMYDDAVITIQESELNPGWTIIGISQDRGCLNQFFTKNNWWTNDDLFVYVGEL